MGDLLARCDAWLGAQFSSQVSQSITYSRGALSVTIAATPSNNNLQVVDANGFSTTMSVTDFSFAASALTFGNGQVDPVKGDRIVWDGRLYEVLPVPGGECFDYYDPARAGIRVHAKVIR